ncbi:FGGY family carbohydrate kinase [Treponema zioleckii]|uniref:FGGY family carbohydrate kinase n=1 Tax=Treponema zioleckii TaxID=331680 RepID=UPI00168A729D|nr:FGGY family carbohydrate kinase [Treponema zioleckii]
MDTILCVDIGTTSLKAALLSDKRTVEAYSRQEIFAEDKTKISQVWLTALKNALLDMKAQNSEAAIEAICVSGNGPTLVAESNGTTFLWNEEILSQKLNPEFNLKSTRSLYIPRLAHFKSNFESEWNGSEYIFSGPEYLIYRLTGKALTILPEERFTDAYWTFDSLKASGFSESDAKKLPPFVKMGSFAGQLTAKAALETGLLEGTLVFCGAPDFVVALLGTGTIYPGTMCDRAGSSEGINLCTASRVTGEGIRTLPSAIPGLWNASVLVENSGRLKDENPEKLSLILKESLERLKNTAENAGEVFPPFMTMTGGQCLDEKWILQKEKACGVKIRVPWCRDAELIGDLILARVGLGDYDDFEEACFVLCR